MNEKLLQNTLAEATTEQGFPTKTGLPVRREVELEDGTIVMVESVTPEKMAQTLKSHFVTPGEKYVDNGNDLNGVVQNYNEGGEAEPESEPVILKVGDSCKLTFKNKYDEDTVNEWANKLLNGEFTNSKVSIKDSSNLIVNADGASEGYVLFKTTNSPEDAYIYLPLSMREAYESNGADVTEFTESGWYKPEFIETESGEAIKLIKVSNLPELTLNNITSIKIDGEEAEEADISDYIANKE